MKLLINPEGGMSGDMFSAALVSAGADFLKVQRAMVAAGETLGSVQVEIGQSHDGASQLAISLDSDRHHLAGREAKEILAGLFLRFDIEEKYRRFGFKTLDILVKSERKAHKEFNIVVEGDHHHPHDHSHDHSHPHEHPHQHEEDALLHEAQDIVIDVMGAATGLQLLAVEPEAELTGPVSVGGGHVHCSHGTLSIPAPATTIILRDYRIEWQKGPIQKELLTPTGAAILAALNAKIYDPGDYTGLEKQISGKARGTKVYDIPALQLDFYAGLQQGISRN
jgi:uncharacterized protein (DUF111 family)